LNAFTLPETSDEVLLSYVPVGGIESVTINGAPLPADRFRLDGNRLTFLDEMSRVAPLGVGGAPVNVEVRYQYGSSNVGSTYVVRFQGELTATDVAQLEVEENADLVAPIFGTGSVLEGGITP